MPCGPAAGDIAIVRGALARWPDPPADAEGASATVRRLLDAMGDAAQDIEAVGPADLAVLVRQIARAEDETSGSKTVLQVPIAEPWPTENDWRAAGCVVLSRNDRGQRVSASPWIPRWLGATSDPTSPTLRGWFRREDAEPSDLRADDFFRAATGKTASDRWVSATRCGWFVAAPEGSTLVANLPTGSGKSAVGYLLALT